MKIQYLLKNISAFTLFNKKKQAGKQCKRANALWKDFNVIIIEPIQAYDNFDLFDGLDLKHDVAS